MEGRTPHRQKRRQIAFLWWPPWDDGKAQHWHHRTDKSLTLRRYNGRRWVPFQRTETSLNVSKKTQWASTTEEWRPHKMGMPHNIERTSRRQWSNWLSGRTNRNRPRPRKRRAIPDKYVKSAKIAQDAEMRTLILRTNGNQGGSTKPPWIRTR